MRGNITRRGKTSWRLKFDLGADPATGERRIEYVTVRGSKKDAEAELSRRLNQVEEGGYVNRSDATIGEYARHWAATIAPSRAAPKTLERYVEIIEKHIVPQIGTVALQKLTGSRVDEFYQHLRTNGRRNRKGGLAAQTVQHIHRLLSQILSSAVKAGALRISPMAAVQTTPKVRREEVHILDDAQLGTLLKHLKGRAIYMPVLMAASTGMRRGEILALRWSDIDLDRQTLQVAQVVEQTSDGLAIKEPKTDRSRRTIALPARLIPELRQHRRAQSELRLKLGQGKSANDLVFPTWEGELRSPQSFSKEFAREVDACDLDVTFHGLRHTHITHLLRSGVPVHVVSARAGHANPTVTLNIYAHLLPGQQEGAAAVVDAALRTALED